MGVEIAFGPVTPTPEAMYSTVELLTSQALLAFPDRYDLFLTWRMANRKDPVEFDSSYNLELNAWPELGRRLRRLGEGLARSGITSVAEVRRAALKFIPEESIDGLKEL